MCVLVCLWHWSSLFLHILRFFHHAFWVAIGIINGLRLSRIECSQVTSMGKFGLHLILDRIFSVSYFLGTPCCYTYLSWLVLRVFLCFLVWLSWFSWWPHSTRFWMGEKCISGSTHVDHWSETVEIKSIIHMIPSIWESGILDRIFSFSPKSHYVSLALHSDPSPYN